MFNMGNRGFVKLYRFAPIACSFIFCIAIYVSFLNKENMFLSETRFKDHTGTIIQIPRGVNDKGHRSNKNTLLHGTNITLEHWTPDWYNVSNSDEDLDDMLKTRMKKIRER